MPATLERKVSLTCHPASAPGAVRAIDVLVRRGGGGRLSLRYGVVCDRRAVRIPAALAPRRADRLWQHTCFEAFLAPGRESGYTELNFAPSGEWAAYRFAGYRAGMSLDGALPAPTVTFAANRAGFELEAAIEPLPSSPEESVRLALAAVIEQADGLAYWALRHPPGKPDFHHPESFALEI